MGGEFLTGLTGFTGLGTATMGRFLTLPQSPGNGPRNVLQELTEATETESFRLPVQIL